MTAFHPIAGAAIADIGIENDALAGNDVTLGNPTVDTTALTQEFALSAPDVTTGNLNS